MTAGMVAEQYQAAMDQQAKYYEERLQNAHDYYKREIDKQIRINDQNNVRSDRLRAQDILDSRNHAARLTLAQMLVDVNASLTRAINALQV